MCARQGREPGCQLARSSQPPGREEFPSHSANEESEGQGHLPKATKLLRKGATLSLLGSTLFLYRSSSRRKELTRDPGCSVGKWHRGQSSAQSLGLAWHTSCPPLLQLPCGPASCQGGLMRVPGQCSHSAALSRESGSLLTPSWAALSHGLPAWGPWKPPPTHQGLQSQHSEG